MVLSGNLVSLRMTPLGCPAPTHLGSNPHPKGHPGQAVLKQDRGHRTHLQDVLYGPLEGCCPPSARGCRQPQDLWQALLPTELALKVSQHDLVVDGVLVRVVALVYHQQ